MIHHIAVALIQQADAVLLVRQQGQTDPVPYWALPGGVVEAGELLTEALIREVCEETGLTVTTVGKLIYMVQTLDQTSEELACVFAVTGWTGSPQVTVDDYVSEAAFIPLAETLIRLESIPFLNMREPILAYLRGEATAGAAWFYRAKTDGSQTLITQLQP